MKKQGADASREERDGGVQSGEERHKDKGTKGYKQHLNAQKQLTTYGHSFHMALPRESRGARGGSRTHTSLRKRDFKSLASAISPPGLLHHFIHIVNQRGIQVIVTLRLLQIGGVYDAPVDELSDYHASIQGHY